jgi:hypothetical protein
MKLAVLYSGRTLKSVAAVSGLLLVSTLGFLAWQHYYPVQSASAWNYHVAYDNLEKAAALARAPSGGVLVTAELRDGKGQLLRVSDSGEQWVIMNHLTKPDGLTEYLGGYAFSQETANAPVSLILNGKVSELFVGHNVQGLFADGRLLYAIEDRKGNGRLLRYDADSQMVAVLRDGLNEAESFAICPDGKMLYSVKDEGVIKQLSPAGKDVTYLAGLKNPTFLLCDERGLWITEDQTHLARLWLQDTSGRLGVVLSHLRAPQEILRLSDGRYLLAEGGRNRVLEINLNR